MQHHHCNMRSRPSSSSMRRSPPMVRCAAEAAPTPRRAMPIQPPYNVLITGSTKGKYWNSIRRSLPCKTNDKALPSGAELHSRDWFPAMCPTLRRLHHACNDAKRVSCNPCMHAPQLHANHVGVNCLSGVGRALAEEFLRLGDSVVISSRSGTCREPHLLVIR